MCITHAVSIIILTNIKESEKLYLILNVVLVATSNMLWGYQVFIYQPCKVCLFFLFHNVGFQWPWTDNQLKCCHSFQTCHTSVEEKKLVLHEFFQIKMDMMHLVAFRIMFFAPTRIGKSVCKFKKLASSFFLGCSCNLVWLLSYA